MKSNARRSTRLGLVVTSCAAAALGLAGCGDRITATRTFTSTAVDSYSMPSPTTPGAYENLDGPLNDSHGTPAPGTSFHQSCYFKGKSARDPGPFSCSGYVKTGGKTYAYSGFSRSLTQGTFGSLYGTGSKARVVVQAGYLGLNSRGQNVRLMTITLRP